MANKYKSLILYPLTGSASLVFPLPFAYDATLSTLQVFLDGVAVSATTYRYEKSPTPQVRFTSLPETGTLMIRRQTNLESRVVDFKPLSLLSDTELNRDACQLFYAMQELSDAYSLVDDDSAGLSSALLSQLSVQMADLQAFVNKSVEEIQAQGAYASATVNVAASTGFECPLVADAATVLTLEFDFSPTGEFEDAEGNLKSDVIHISSADALEMDAGFYLQDGDGALLASYAGNGVRQTDAGKMMLMKAGELTCLKAGETYFYRARWENAGGVEASPYQYGTVGMPAANTGGGTGGGTPVTPGTLDTSMIPPTVTGLQPRTSENLITVSPGSCLDSTGSVLLTTGTELTCTVPSVPSVTFPMLDRNSEYELLICRDSTDDEGAPGLYLHKGTPKYTVPWVNPEMLGFKTPAGYTASASFLHADAAQRYSPWRAFSKDAQEWYGAASTPVLPAEGAVYLELVFDTPKLLNFFKITSGAGACYVKRGVFKVRDANGVWKRVTDTVKSTGVTADKREISLLAVANASDSYALETPLLAHGVRFEVIELHAVGAPRINEIVVEGHEAAYDPAEKPKLPEPYDVYRVLGTIRTDDSGKLALGSSASMPTQAVSHLRGRVWVSEPFNLIAKALLTKDTHPGLGHNLDLDPLYVRAEVILECLIADLGFVPGDLVVPSGQLPPLVRRNSVELKQPGAYNVVRQTDGAVVALALASTTVPPRWCGRIRLFY